MNFLISLFQNNKFKNINGKEFNDMRRNQEDLLILDVRTLDEYEKGHILKAKNIFIKDITEKLEMIKVYKNKPIIVYCSSGSRSYLASKKLSKEGFTKIYNLSGGILNHRSLLK